MSRRASAFTQADVFRIINGARQAGARVVYIEMPSGVTFSIPLDKNFKASDIIGNARFDDEEEASFTL